MKRIRRLLVIAASVVAPLAIAVPARAAEVNSVVTPLTPGWGFVVEGGSGNGSFVNGPSPAPLGIGSVELRTNSAADGVIFGTLGYGGTRLADVTELSYETYMQNGNNLVAPTFQFAFDDDVTDTNTTWKGRLVYEPYMNGSVTDGSWQSWNASSNDAVWWTTWGGANTLCKQANPCTKSEILSNWPDAGINSAAPQVLFKAGSGWSGIFKGNVDNFRFGVGSDIQVYNFDPVVSLADKDACKNGGWMNSNTPFYKNQGDCVSYFATGMKNSASTKMTNNPKF